MKTKTLICAFIILLLGSCMTTFKNSQQLENVTKNQKIVLSIPNESLPHGISLKVVGELDGNATLKISNSEKIIYTYFIENGIIDKNLGSDWYDTVCYIEYIPEDVSNGNLKFLYEFYF